MGFGNITWVNAWATEKSVEILDDYCILPKDKCLRHFEFFKIGSGGCRLTAPTNDCPNHYECPALCGNCFDFEQPTHAVN